MMGWNGLEVCAALLAASYGLVALLSLSNRALDWMLDRISTRQRITVERNECPTCLRVETIGHRPYDAGLGYSYTRSYDRCLACRHASRERIELDLETTSLDTIRRLDPDYQAANQSR